MEYKDYCGETKNLANAGLDVVERVESFKQHHLLNLPEVARLVSYISINQHSLAFLHCW